MQEKYLKKKFHLAAPTNRPKPQRVQTVNRKEK